MVPRGNSVPHVRIEIVKGRSLEERQQLFQAVHEALMDAFRIPDDDRTQRIVEHEPENFEIPPGSSERYTLIEITAFPGRSADAKRNLYRTLVQRLGEIAIDPTSASSARPRSGNGRCSCPASMHRSQRRNADRRREPRRRGTP
jgi:hypothetical protein